MTTADIVKQAAFLTRDEMEAALQAKPSTRDDWLQTAQWLKSVADHLTGEIEFDRRCGGPLSDHVRLSIEQAEQIADGLNQITHVLRIALAVGHVQVRE